MAKRTKPEDLLEPFRSYLVSAYEDEQKEPEGEECFDIYAVGKSLNYDDEKTRSIVRRLDKLGYLVAPVPLTDCTTLTPEGREIAKALWKEENGEG